MKFYSARDVLLASLVIVGLLLSGCDGDSEETGVSSQGSSDIDGASDYRNDDTSPEQGDTPNEASSSTPDAPADDAESESSAQEPAEDSIIDGNDADPQETETPSTDDEPAAEDSSDVDGDATDVDADADDSETASSDGEEDNGEVGLDPTVGDDPDGSAESEEAGSGESNLVENVALAFDFVGEFTDGYGTHTIQGDTWTQQYDGSSPSIFHFRSYDADSRVLIAENDGANEYNPGKWSRFDIAVKNDGLWYCQTKPDADTQADAEATPAASADDVATTGCGNFAWSSLSLAVAPTVAGQFSDDFGGTHDITQRAWTQAYEGSEPSHFIFTQWAPDAERIIAYNADGNSYAAGLWSAFYFFTNDVGTYYCQAIFDAETADAASAGDPPSTDDVAGSGCGVGSWTRLIAVPGDDPGVNATDGTGDSST